MEEKVIVFCPGDVTSHYQQLEMIHNYREAKSAIKERKSFKTTQMALLSTILFDQGYVVLLAEGDRLVPIRLGENTSTGRWIRMGHNLFNLWLVGEFL